MLYIILPAYNEEGGLSDLISDIVRSCLGIPLQIIVVNDASSDQTLQIALAAREIYPNITVLNHDSNKGLGGALLTGFSEALRLRVKAKQVSGDPSWQEDVIITMDADNTHSAEYIPRMLREIESGADLVIASRFAVGGEQNGLSFGRKFLSWGAGKLMSLFFPVEGLRDYSCGYRAYRATVLERVCLLYGEQLIESRSFAAMVELLLKVLLVCRDVREIPFALHYEKKCGESKMRILETILGYLALIIQMKRRMWGTLVWAKE